MLPWPKGRQFKASYSVGWMDKSGPGSSQRLKSVSYYHCDSKNGGVVTLFMYQEPF